MAEKTDCEVFREKIIEKFSQQLGGPVTIPELEDWCSKCYALKVNPARRMRKILEGICDVYFYDVRSLTGWRFGPLLAIMYNPETKNLRFDIMHPGAVSSGTMGI